jgi:ankyrin repeat protein
MVGLNESEAGTLEMYLDFHKWIFQQTEAKIVPTETIDSSKRLFGFESDRYGYDNDILVVRTENSVETMVAQDIYIQFLHNALKPTNAFKGDTLLNDSIHSSTFRQSFFAKNSQIEELIHCFESCMLGSREDALLCAIPTLRSLNLLPELAGDSVQVRKQIKNLISQSNWEKAFRVLEWICERSQGDELRHSAYELGYLCRRALMVHDTSIRETGLIYTCKILKKDIRGDFLNSKHVRTPMHWSESSQLEPWLGRFARELGWIAWHISNNIPSAECIQPTLKAHGVLESLDTSAESDKDASLSVAMVKATQEFLTLSAWDVHHRDLEGNDDELGYAWALKEDLGAIAYFIMMRWAEVGAQHPVLCQRAFSIAARHPTGHGVNVLLRHDADIGASDERTISALLQAIDDNDLIAAGTLLENGANPNGNEKGPDANPLGLCAQRDLTDMARLLLGHGASVYTTDASGMSALHWASNENKLGIARLLLSHGANVGKFGADGVIPLHCAVRNNYLEMTELLLKAGSETDAPGGNREKTSLMFAADSGFVDIVYMLLANGANIHARDTKGLTALDWAKISNRSDIVNILEEATRMKA